MDRKSEILLILVFVYLACMTLSSGENPQSPQKETKTVEKVTDNVKPQGRGNIDTSLDQTKQTVHDKTEKGQTVILETKSNIQTKPSISDSHDLDYKNEKQNVNIEKVTFSNEKKSQDNVQPSDAIQEKVAQQNPKEQFGDSHKNDKEETNQISGPGPSSEKGEGFQTKNSGGIKKDESESLENKNEVLKTVLEKGKENPAEYSVQGSGKKSVEDAASEKEFNEWLEEHSSEGTKEPERSGNSGVHSSSSSTNNVHSSSSNTDKGVTSTSKYNPSGKHVHTSHNSQKISFGQEKSFGNTKKRMKFIEVNRESEKLVKSIEKNEDDTKSNKMSRREGVVSTEEKKQKLNTKEETMHMLNEELLKQINPQAYEQLKPQTAKHFQKVLQKTQTVLKDQALKQLFQNEYYESDKHNEEMTGKYDEKDQGTIEDQNAKSPSKPQHTLYQWEDNRDSDPMSVQKHSESQLEDWWSAAQEEPQHDLIAGREEYIKNFYKYKYPDSYTQSRKYTASDFPAVINERRVNMELVDKITKRLNGNKRMETIIYKPNKDGTVRGQTYILAIQPTGEITVQVKDYIQPGSPVQLETNYRTLDDIPLETKKGKSRELPFLWTLEI